VKKINEIRVASILVCLFVAGPCARPAATQNPVPGTASPASPRPDSGATGPVDPTQPRTGPRDQRQQATGTARISGRVIAGEAGLPLRRALVRVHGEALPETRIATTDENGRYELKDLPAGKLFITASKAGYVGMTHGQRRPDEGGRPLEVREGQRVDGINFNLSKGAVIAGRIADEFGEPIAELPVSVLKYRYIDGRRQLTPAGGPPSRTDDLGRFRVFGLAAGDYYVKAAGQTGMFMGAQSDDRSGFAPTYFPGTPSLGEAQRIRVGAGEELSAINFSVLQARTSRINGLVIDSQGQPVSRGFIMVQESPKGMPFFTMSGGGGIRPDGTFTISNISPGEYVLHVNLGMGSEDAESASVPVTVASEDIDGLTIVTSRGTRISGQVMFQTAPADSVKPAEFNFFASAIEPVSPMRGMILKVNDDWTFETRLHEGPVLIRGTKLADGWLLKAVLHHGSDVTDTGIDIDSGSSVDGVELVLSNRISTVTGTVIDERRQLAPDYVVVVFAADPARWGQSSRHVFAARPTQQGRFEITKLPAGQYLAAAVPYLEEGQQTDPEYLAELRHDAVPFDLSDGERKVLTLNLVKR
jgi:hypothetical protein